MSNTPTTNFGYNKPAIGDRGWGTTQNGNWDTLDTDFSVEHRSDSGNHGKHGPKVTIVQSGADNALVITKSNTGAGNVVGITNSGTGYGVNISQPGESTALNIVTSATGNQPILVFAPRLGPYFEVTSTGGYAMSVVKSATGSGIAFSLTNSGSGEGIHLDQDGGGIGMRIDQVGDNIALDLNQTVTSNSSNVIDISNSGTGTGIHIGQNNTGYGLEVLHSGAGTGAHIYVSATNGGSALWLESSATGSAFNLFSFGTTTGKAVNIRQDKADYGIYLDQRGDAVGLCVSKSTGTANAAEVTNSGTGYGALIAQVGNAVGIQLNSSSTSYAGQVINSKYCAAYTMTADAGYGLAITQQVDTIEPNSGIGLFAINKTGTGASPAMILNNSGTGAGVQINQTGNGIALDLNQTNTAGASNVIDIINSGTGKSIAVDSTGMGVYVVERDTAGWAAQFITAGSGVMIKKANTTGTNNVLLEIDNTSGTGITVDINALSTSNAANVVDINNSGTGYSIGISQVGEQRALNVISSATGQQCICVQGKYGQSINVDSSGGYGLYVGQTSTGVGEPDASFGLIAAYKQTTGSSPVVYISNAGTGDSILDDSGAKLTAAGSFTSVSTRLSKQNLEELNTVIFQDAGQKVTDIGEKIDAVKVYRFESKRVPGYKHIGVMAEDFYEAFGVGEDDKTISPTDVAAILWHEIQRLRIRIKALEEGK